MAKITYVRQNTNNSIFFFLNQKLPQNSHQCDNKYFFVNLTWLRSPLWDKTLIIVSFFLEIKRVHKIHINVTINTFVCISNMTKITAVRQNTNSSIFLFLNQKWPQNSHQCDNKYFFIYLTWQKSALWDKTLLIVSFFSINQNSHQCDNKYIFCLSNTTKITSVRQNTNNSIFLSLNQKQLQNSHQCDNKEIFLYIQHDQNHLCVTKH